MAFRIGKLLLGIACISNVSACDVLPLQFENLSERERLKFGSEALITSCVPMSVEDDWTSERESAIQLTRDYIDFIRRSSKKGELAKYLSPRAQLACSNNELEGRIFMNIREVIYLYGTDIEIKASLNETFKGIDRSVKCSELDSSSVLANRVEMIWCGD
jgi:hypothetical protein